MRRINAAVQATSENGLLWMLIAAFSWAGIDAFMFFSLFETL
jgi:hypothetical protein